MGTVFQPSTDGAWFELYRNMLVRETEENTLFLMQATPRAWLEDGKRIWVQDVPTLYGNLSFSVVSAVKSKKIRAEIEMPVQSGQKFCRCAFATPKTNRSAT